LRIGGSWATLPLTRFNPKHLDEAGQWGANRVTSGRLARLAGVFGVPLATLFDGIEGRPAGALLMCGYFA
jgi:hypothetical protein